MSEGINILQNALNDSNKQNQTANTTENKEEIKKDVGVERNASDEEGVPSVQDTAQNNEKISGGVENAGKDVGHETFKKGLSIFSDLKKATEEDKDIKEAKGLVDNLADKVSSGLDIDAEGEKLAYKMKAEIYIDVIDWLATMGLCWMTKDFSEANKTKFSLHKDRRKVIADKWAQYMVITKAKVNPKADLIVFIAGSYIPLIGVACMIRFGKKDNPMPSMQNVSGNQQYYQPQQQQPPTYQHTQNNVVFEPQESSYKGPFGEDMVKKRGVQKGAKRGPYKKDE